MIDARDLFLAVWQMAMAAEHAVKPGSPEWNAARARHWFDVWADCRATAAMLAGACSLPEPLELVTDSVATPEGADDIDDASEPDTIVQNADHE